MINLQTLKVRNVTTPTKAHDTDAGIDFYSPTDFQQPIVTIKPGESIVIPSGIKMAIPKGWCLTFFNKSGVSTKHGLVVGACVIDSGYTGEIHIHLINTNSQKTVSLDLYTGCKLAQGLLMEVPDVNIEVVNQEEFDLIGQPSTRGNGGFGSTGA